MEQVPADPTMDPSVYVFNQITLPFSEDFSKYKNICFISSIVEDSCTFSQYVNADTYPVIYNSSADRDHLKTSLLSQFTAIDRVTFVFHGAVTASDSPFTPTRFINDEMFFTIDETTGNAVGGENHVFVQDLCNALNVKHVDFMACNLLQSLKWQKYFALFQNVVVGASIDNTGNLKYGGNWVMETTMENIRPIYFDQNKIDDFAGLLINYTYSVQINGNTRTLTYSLDANNNVSIVGISVDWTEALVIPSSIDGNPVKTVTGLQWSKISSIVIPVGVTKIGLAGMSNCRLLTTISLPEGLIYIGYEAMGSCTQLTSITIPNSMGYTGSDLGMRVFVGCSKLMTVNLPNGLTNIPPAFFRECSSLTSILLPDSITIIKSEAFAYCYELSTLNLPEGLTEIGDFAFRSTKITGEDFIPTTVTSIGHQAFAGCLGFTSITIPGVITYWAWMSFLGCTNLISVTIGHGITTIPADAFFQCFKLTTVHLPNTLTTIGATAFSSCPMGKIVFPSSVTKFMNIPFYNCSSIPSVYFCGNTIPEFTLTPYILPPFHNGNGIGNFINPLKTYYLSTVTNTNGLSGFTSPTHEMIPLTPSAMFDQMKLDSVSVSDIYNCGLFTMGFIKTQYTIEQMYTGGITVGQLSSGGITIAEMLTAVPSIATNLAKIIKSNPSAYVPTIPTSSGTTVSLPSISTLDLTSTAIIGSTVTEQKSFTSATVKSLFRANAAGKRLKLPVGSILPGFSQSLTSEVYLINASSSVANNNVSVVPKADIIGKTFYVLLEAGDAITIDTHNGTVSVSKTGSTFTLTPSTGSSVTKTSGDTYSYDGLTLSLGSVFGTLAQTSVNFVLSALNSQFVLSASGTLPNYSPTLTSDAVITLDTPVSAGVIQNTFFYRTDPDITLDASFVYYYVDSSKWTNKSTVLNPKNGIVTTNMYVSEDAVGKDFLRDLAKQLFGTYLGADLFTNEDSVIFDINTRCDEVATNAVALINSVDKTVGSSNLLKTDASGGRYLDDNLSTSNISRELFNQLMTSAPSRFNDTKLDKYNTEEDGFYKLPILQGDSISFKMTVSPSITQTSAINTGPTSLLSRSYIVVMNVGA